MLQNKRSGANYIQIKHKVSVIQKDEKQTNKTFLFLTFRCLPLNIFKIESNYLPSVIITIDKIQLMFTLGEMPS